VNRKQLPYQLTTNACVARGRRDDGRAEMCGVCLIPNPAEPDLPHYCARFGINRLELHSPRSVGTRVRQEELRELIFIQREFEIPRTAPLDHLLIRTNPFKQRLKVCLLDGLQFDVHRLVLID